MKKLPTFLLLLAPLLLATSCQDDDVQLQTTAVQMPQQPQEPQQPEEPEQPQSAEGRWSLINISGSIAGVSNNFPEGQITWTFNPDSTIDIVNGNPDENVEDFLDSGNYVFGFIPNEMQSGCNEVMFVWCFTVGCQNISGDMMTLTQPENDGYTLMFKKAAQ